MDRFSTNFPFPSTWTILITQLRKFSDSHTLSSAKKDRRKRNNYSFSCSLRNTHVILKMSNQNYVFLNVPVKLTCLLRIQFLVLKCFSALNAKKVLAKKVLFLFVSFKPKGERYLQKYFKTLIGSDHPSLAVLRIFWLYFLWR